MKNYVLAHDLGTTGNKATLYDAEGMLVDSAFYAYSTDYPHTGRNHSPGRQDLCNNQTCLSSMG